MIEQGDAALAMDEVEDDEDMEDDEVKATDSMLVVAVTEDDFSHLEVQLFTEDGSLFVHHDINLPELPLCMAWLDCPPFLVDGAQQMVGNYMAVGTFDPVIEIWNLDVLDPLEPSASLGGELHEPGRRKKKGAAPRYKAGSHEGAVMALSWNKRFRQALASGSADQTVKVWDVTTQQCSLHLQPHADKVQRSLCYRTRLSVEPAHSNTLLAHFSDFSHRLPSSFLLCLLVLIARSNRFCGTAMPPGCWPAAPSTSASL